MTVIVGLGAGAGVAVVPPDSLTLQRPENVKAWRVYTEDQRGFIVYLTWSDIPDSCATFMHQPDTTGWAVEHTSAEMSSPNSGGVYSGDIDRTISFRARDSGEVGVTESIQIEYAIRDEEFLNGTINVGTNFYAPGSLITVRFRNTLQGSPDFGKFFDFGIRLRFSAGFVDRQGGFLLGVEDFEGYHIWRGIEPDGSDLTVIGELSKEEAHVGSMTGGSIIDSVYYYSVIPTLRDSLTWFSPFGTIDCLGRRIDVELADDELFWYDCNGFNGYTYYYAVTTFDRDYGVSSGRQGLFKFDHCQPAQGVAYECPDELVPLSIEVDAQSDVKRVYAVPNPYRTGGSVLTQQNYHNFPDDKIRFVNVPPTASMKIFTLAGDLVWETEHDGIDGNIEWDVRNLGGNDVGSGVYIYKVEADGDVVYGRLVIIR